MLREGREPIKGYMHVIQSTSSRISSIKEARALEHGSSKILLQFFMGQQARRPDRPIT